MAEMFARFMALRNRYILDYKLFMQLCLNSYDYLMQPMCKFQKEEIESLKELNYVPTIIGQIPLHILKLIPKQKSLIHVFHSLNQSKLLLADTLYGFLVVIQLNINRVIRCMNQLFLEIEEIEADLKQFSGDVPVSQETYPMTWIALQIAALDLDLSGVVCEAETDTEVADGRKRHFYLIKFLPTAKNLNLNLVSPQLFINYIIIIYTIYIFHLIIYKLIIPDQSEMQPSNADNKKAVVIKTSGVNEYSYGVLYKGRKVQKESVDDIIKEKLYINEWSKLRHYCNRCNDIDHVDPSNCIRRCTKCYGNHWTKQCTVWNICNWCGMKKGDHTCIEANLARLFVVCPICRLHGHVAKNCSEFMVAFSELFGPLRRVFIRRKRRRFRRFGRSMRRIRRRRRWRK